MKSGNDLPSSGTKKKEFQSYDYSLFRNRMEELRGETSRKAFAKKLGIDEKTYRNWVNGGTQRGVFSYKTPTLDNLISICEKLNVSLDYLLGRSKYTSVSNELVGKEYGLSNDALIGIKNIRFVDSEIVKEWEKAISEGKEITFTGTHLSLLNYMLSSIPFLALLSDLLEYTFPVFNVPVFYNKKKDSWESPKDEYSHCGDNDDWNLYLARSVDNPHDNKLVTLNTHFLEGVAKNNLDKDLRAIRNGYLKSLLNENEKPLEWKWVDD